QIHSDVRLSGRRFTPERLAASIRDANRLDFVRVKLRNYEHAARIGAAEKARSVPACSRRSRAHGYVGRGLAFAGHTDSQRNTAMSPNAAELLRAEKRHREEVAWTFH